MGAEMSEENQETNDTRFGGVNTSNLKNDCEQFLHREELHLKETNLGSAVG